MKINLRVLDEIEERDRRHFADVDVKIEGYDLAASAKKVSQKHNRMLGIQGHRFCNNYA